MQIKVRLFATLREGREKEYLMTLNKSETVLDITNRLDINAQDIAILLVNGMDRPLEIGIQDGDVVSIFPPVGGG